ncbi:hypothetical protein Val02_35330 [Virgisporangium aliadipatigenens]|uniref:Uncharacterized protein n=1 Tax=Virgisporangium aliadipatigenens TaxID=741659 RepID=A0A8J4DRU1_9ACTN|nr:hypothetical protein [Virgisporangium aliadipatigenens]GIJ46647.1 hypothetical protein Val02_35330 [Virgisporangium aliadipatigenens]
MPPPRLRPYLLWEAVLLVGVLVAVPLAAGSDEDAPWLLAGDIALVGFLAGAFALSLRTGTPNLAVGGLAATGGVLTAGLAEVGLTALVGVLIFGAVAGLSMVALVVPLRLPAWAVSTAALALLLPLAAAFSDGRIVGLGGDGALPGVGVVLLVTFGLGSVGVALWWQRAGSGGRWTLDGPDARLRPAMVGLLATSVVATVGGALIAFWQGAATPGQPPQVTLAVAAALLGGTGVRGRLAGVAGTALATALVVSLHRWVEAETYPPAANLVVGLLAAVGLIAGAVLSRFTTNARNAPERPKAPVT